MVGLTQSGSSSIREPEYWWYRARTEPRRPHSGTSSGPPLPARRGQRTVRASRDAGRPRAVRDRPGPRGSRPGRACAPPPSPCRSGRARSTSSGPSTSSSTASPRSSVGGAGSRPYPRRSAARVGAGLPVGLVGPRRPRRPLPPLHAAAAGRGRRGRRTDRAPLDVRVCGVFPFFAAERVTRRVRVAPGGTPAGLPRVPSTLDRVLTGLSSAEAGPAPPRFASARRSSWPPRSPSRP